MVVRAGLAVVVAAIGLVATPATPAHASSDQCPYAEFCMWSNINYSGAMYAAAENTSDINMTRWKISTSYCPQGTWNDCGSSAYNKGLSGKGVILYQDINWNGGTFCIPQGAVTLYNFNYITFSNGTDLNNNASSLWWTYSC